MLEIEEQKIRTYIQAEQGNKIKTTQAKFPGFCKKIKVAQDICAITHLKAANKLKKISHYLKINLTQSPVVSSS